MKKLCTLFVVFSAVCWSQTPADVPAQGGMRGHGTPAQNGVKLTPEMRERLLKKFDANGNGRLDEDEIAAARKAKADRQKEHAARPQGEHSGHRGGMRRRPAGGGE